MAFTSFLTAVTPTNQHQRHRADDRHEIKKKKKKKKLQPPPLSSSSSSSWEQFKSLLSCRSAAAAVASQVHDPSSSSSPARLGRRAACGSSICALRDVVHGNTRVVHRSDTDPSSDAGSVLNRHEAAPPLAAGSSSARHRPAPVSSSLGCGSYSRGGMQLPKLSGCYECHAVVSIEPSSSRRYPRPTTTLCACPECGEVFTKADSLEMHQAVRHAVSELGPEDSGRNIVEIIFKSSWQKKDRPICQIERILKVHNAPRTVARFEDYRAAVKSRSSLPHLSGARHHHHPSRCAADGNELLRFHCTSLSCPLGACGSTSLCHSSSSSSPSACGVCAIIRHGFAQGHHPQGVRTTASSGRAHDCGPPAAEDGGGEERRAMLVCRVIAGRVRRPGDDRAATAAEEEETAYDSVAVGDGGSGNLEELLVANPRAILPCFVVIYRGALDERDPSKIY